MYILREVKCCCAAEATVFHVLLLCSSSERSKAQLPWALQHTMSHKRFNNMQIGNTTTTTAAIFSIFLAQRLSPSLVLQTKIRKTKQTKKLQECLYRGETNDGKSLRLILWNYDLKRSIIFLGTVGCWQCKISSLSCYNLIENYSIILRGQEQGIGSFSLSTFANYRSRVITPYQKVVMTITIMNS